jgi:hypothetical protein
MALSLANFLKKKTGGADRKTSARSGPARPLRSPTAFLGPLDKDSQGGWRWKNARVDLREELPRLFSL